MPETPPLPFRPWLRRRVKDHSVSGCVPRPSGRAWIIEQKVHVPTLWYVPAYIVDLTPVLAGIAIEMKCDLKNHLAQVGQVRFIRLWENILGVPLHLRNKPGSP